MPGLILWKNQEINRLRRDIDRLFARLWDDFGMPLTQMTDREMPFMDVSETSDALIIKAEVPGISPEDLKISITENVLTIKGESKPVNREDVEGFHRAERKYGYFSRTLELPCKIVIDDVKATYEKGIVTIVMPKCEANRAREIRVSIK